jgi:WD40 repeat protein
VEGERLQTLHGHTNPVHLLVWSPDGQRLITRDRDNGLRIWSTKDWTMEAIILPLPLNKLATISADGRFVHGDPKAIDDMFLFLVETPTGAMETISYPEFQKRAAAK